MVSSSVNVVSVDTVVAVGGGGGKNTVDIDCVIIRSELDREYSEKRDVEEHGSIDLQGFVLLRLFFDLERRLRGEEDEVIEGEVRSGWEAEANVCMVTGGSFFQPLPFLLLTITRTVFPSGSPLALGTFVWWFCLLLNSFFMMLKEDVEGGCC